MGKRGSMHFEMIISFVFFAGFVSFLFFTIEPYDSSILPYSALNALETSFSEYLEEDLISFSIYIANPGISCYDVVLENEDFKKVPSDDAGSAVIGGGDGLDSVVVVEPTKITLSFNGDNGVKLYKAFISKGLPNDNGFVSCTLLSNNLAGLEEKKIIPTSNLVDMKDEYEISYAELKEKLKIPGIFDFEIISVDLEGLDMKRDVPVSLEVIASESTYEVLLENGTIINSRFTLRIW